MHLSHVVLATILLVSTASPLAAKSLFSRDAMKYCRGLQVICDQTVADPPLTKDDLCHPQNLGAVGTIELPNAVERCQAAYDRIAASDEEYIGADISSAIGTGSPGDLAVLITAASGIVKREGAMESEKTLRSYHDDWRPLAGRRPSQRIRQPCDAAKSRACRAVAAAPGYLYRNGELHCFPAREIVVPRRTGDNHVDARRGCTTAGFGWGWGIEYAQNDMVAACSDQIVTFKTDVDGDEQCRRVMKNGNAILIRLYTVDFGDYRAFCAVPLLSFRIMEE